MAAELSTIYRQIADNKAQQYEFLFSLESIFLSLMEFDPVTDEPLQVTVDDVLHKISSLDVQQNNWQNDRLNHIVQFVSAAVHSLIDILHEKNLREHRISRPEQIREVDSKCMMWLAKKPGFTVKQKIASEQSMMGVFHITSIDTAENRLFKAFMQKLDELLIEKENACRKRGLVLSDEADRFVSIVHNWLKSEESLLIGRWNNTPPNNTLLNDKNYRKIWKAHLMLQNLNELVQSDLDNLDKLKASAIFWFTAAKLNLNNDIRFRQTVLFPDYAKLSINKRGENLVGFVKTDKWGTFNYSLNGKAVKLLLNEINKEIPMSDDIGKISDIYFSAVQGCLQFFPEKKFVPSLKQVQDDGDDSKKQKTVERGAVDLCSVLPYYAIDGVNKGRFSKKLIHQSLYINQNKKNAWYPCSSARSKLIFTKSKEIQTFSIHHIFDEKLRSEIDSVDDKTGIEKACADFARTIKDELHCQKCLYITSDDLDDFSPAVNTFKYSMNSAFSKTEILPRSIAVLFTHLPDIQNSFHQNDIITVRAIHDDYEVQTKIRIEYDKKLADKNPETKGITFQRLASIRENREKSKTAAPQNLLPQNLDGILTAYDASILKNSFSVDNFHFEAKVSFSKTAAQNKEIIIYSADDTSFGAVEYDRLQSITPDIPLWRDVLPKLSMVDSTGKEYVLVEPQKVSIRPIVGKPVHIPIPWKFSFPAQKEFYEFPLMQGEKKGKSKYFAFIKDSSFPLEQETECKLYLTYTYGIPLPYSLEFTPAADSAEFKSVAVKWENKSHKDYINDMPVPNFVREYTWADMRHVPGRKKEGKKDTSNLVDEWLPKEYEKILNSGTYEIINQIRSRRDDTDVFFLEAEDEEEPICYIDSKYEAEEGDFVWCYIKETPRGFQAFDPHVIGKKYNDCDFRKSLRFPVITVWNNGRSIKNKDCPKNFRQETLKVLDKLKDCFGKDVPKCVQQQYRFFLSCMHKDMPDWSVQFLSSIIDKIEKEFDYPNCITYALGDCSAKWQKDLLKKILTLLDNKKSVYAIKILAKALWRVNDFVFNLKTDDVKKLLASIRAEICSNKNQEPEQVAVLSACLECIVALCRLRKTKKGDAADKEMLSILSPAENKDAEQIAEKLRKLKESKSKIKTFLSFEIDRPADDKTHELLYAAYGYLSGMIDSNAIRVLEADFGEGE